MSNIVFFVMILFCFVLLRIRGWALRCRFWRRSLMTTNFMYSGLFQFVADRCAITGHGRSFPNNVYSSGTIPAYIGHEPVILFVLNLNLKSRWDSFFPFSVHVYSQAVDWKAWHAIGRWCRVCRLPVIASGCAYLQAAILIDALKNIYEQNKESMHKNPFRLFYIPQLFIRIQIRNWRRDGRSSLEGII